MTEAAAQLTLQVDVLDLLDLPRRGLLSIEEAAKVLGVSRATAYRGASDGWLPTRQIGSQRYVPVFDLLRLCGAEVVDAPSIDLPRPAAAGDGRAS